MVIWKFILIVLNKLDIKKKLYINIMNNQCITLQHPKKFNVNENTRLDDDVCFEQIETKQSMESGNYYIRNFRGCDFKKVEEFAHSQPRIMIQYPDGYLNNPKIVDISSKLRNQNMTNFKGINQLQGYPYTTSPNLSRGKGNICVESFLKSSEDTFQQRPCNNLAGMNINRFTPMVSCLKDNIQKPTHIIPELVDSEWIRGGQASRQIIREKNYLEKCGYKYNGKFWVKA